MFLTIIVFIVILGLLVLVHEFGHFFVARKMGVTVEEFGFGFPPRIFGIKKAGTLFSLNWIPLGGFCKIKGDEGGNPSEKDSFVSKKISEKVAIISAGVIMNVFLAFILFSIGFMIGFPQALNKETIKGAKKINQPQIQIMSVLENSPAQKAGIQLGDVISEVDGQKFEDVSLFQKYIKNIEKETIIKIKRGDKFLEKKIYPEFSEKVNGKIIGTQLVSTGIISYSWHQSIYLGAKTTIFLTFEIIKAFCLLIKNLIIHQTLSADISGPVGIVIMTKQMVNLGFIYILQFTALLSLNLAVINFIPFPALDGGRILFLIIEKIRRKPINQEIENITHSIGFALLMLLIIIITYQDIVKFGGKILKALLRIF
ncbi:RIP metalloprotease RseP [Candidatus Kuenenbacteria bacterium HGW-Kuenenbacteria-1]|uniref:Zinc metalloprotease n=1 Tax=Candidatus Kuenenbacteria bacterium HGW-Kuenenbacteria-1 TaxID=2013812 RepID=A0A2N1UP45_9BACT|nr:MAG: RIP metalloprotease RseP [Candidatus Kuenenbacteria bacterium HGW-Kuenenbacteria-1]